MPLPETLKDPLDGARSCIERADNINITSLASIAEEALRRIKAYVVATPDINAAIGEAIGRLADFHEEVVDQNTLIPRVTSAIENARQIALLALDRLEEALAEARPSELAIALTVDWY